jgi:hypothetical protein
VTVRHVNPVTQAGFTQIPNDVMLRTHLSVGARFLYGYLKHLAWRNGGTEAESGREQIYSDLGIGRNQVTAYIKELCAEPAAAGDTSPDTPRLVIAQRRGLGLTNLYLINDPGECAKHESFLQEATNDVLTPSSQELELRSEPAKAVSPVYDPLKGTKIGVRNLPWDALVEETQADERLEAGRIAAALKKIRSALAESWTEHDTPEGFEGYIASEVRERAALYRDRWPNVELTPTALAANWSRVTTPQPGRSLDTALEAAQRGIDSARRTA